MDNFSKALVFLFLAMGVGIFLMVVMMKVDVFAAKVKAEVKSNAAELDWEGYLYHQTVQNVIKSRANKE